MVKKLNRDALLIKILLNKGASCADISQILNVSRQKVFYWAKHDIKTSRINRRKKLPEEYYQKIINLAKNSAANTLSSRKICAIINQELEQKNILGSNNKPLMINRTSVCRYLKEFYGKPKQVKKVFILSEEQMKSRENFCKMITERNINYDQIMFTDECIIDLNSYTQDWTRIDPEVQEKLRNADPETIKMYNRNNKKFEKCMMIAGGISYYGLSHLIFLEGTMNDFAYGQALMFYKDDIDEIRDKHGIKLIFEQDGAATHKTKANVALLNKLFSKNGWIQNAPHSSDLAYPIEDLWGLIKPRVRKRNPRSVPELKKCLLEEWASVPIELIQNLCKGFNERIQKVLELKGAKSEPEHYKKGAKEIVYEWKLPETLPHMRIVYNNKKIYKYKKREMRIIKEEMRKLKTLNVEKLKDKEVEETNPNLVEYSNLIKDVLENEGVEKAAQKKQEYIRGVRDMLENIQDMNLVEYIEHLQDIAKENKKKEDVEEDSQDDIEILDEIVPHDQKRVNEQMDNITIEQKITDLLKMKNVDKHIKYKIRF